MTSPACIRCGVLCKEVPRGNEWVCAWCVREVGEGGKYCEECNRYHAGTCADEDRRLRTLQTIGAITEYKGLLPDDVAVFFERVRK